MSGAGDRFAEACFVASSTARALTEQNEARADAATGRGQLSFAELAHALLHPGHEEAAELLTVAMADPRTAPQAEALLARLSMVSFEAVAAASSGAVSERVTDRFRLRLHEAADAGGAAYLLVERVDGGEEVPQRICAVSPDGTCSLSDFPEGAEGITQLLLDPGDSLLQAVRDPDSRLYLT